jgi:hypothetical protein
MKPVRFQLVQSVELLTAHSGLALIGLLLSHTRMAKRTYFQSSSLPSTQIGTFLGRFRLLFGSFTDSGHIRIIQKNPINVSRGDWLFFRHLFTQF